LMEIWLFALVILSMKIWKKRVLNSFNFKSYRIVLACVAQIIPQSRRKRMFCMTDSWCDILIFWYIFQTRKMQSTGYRWFKRQTSRTAYP
jgi:hypothetical protein